MLISDENIIDNIVKTDFKNLYLLPSNIQLAGAEIELVPAISREYRIKNAIEDIEDEFDFIIIDCPPSLGYYIKCTNSCNAVLVPIQCEYYALEGLGQLMNTIGLVQNQIKSCR